MSISKFVPIAFFFLSSISYSQINEGGKIEFEDFNTTTYVLISLMEKAAVKGEDEIVNLHLNTLTNLMKKYDMKTYHKQRIEKFRKDNKSLSKAFLISFEGIVATPGRFVHYELPYLVKKLEELSSLDLQIINPQLLQDISSEIPPKFTELDINKQSQINNLQNLIEKVKAQNN